LARDASSTGIFSGGSDTYDANLSIPYTVNACASVTLSAFPQSPKTVGTQVTLTAGSACSSPNPQYKFVARWQGSSGWVQLYGYSTSNTYTWDSTGAASGTEYLGVWVRDANSLGVYGTPPDSYDANLSIPYTVNACTSAGIAASPPSPTTAGTQVTVTASAVCSSLSPLYKFLGKWQGSTTWQPLQGFSSNTTYSWNSTGALSGMEYLGVWVRDANGTGIFGTLPDSYDATASVPYEVNACTSVSITMSPGSPQVHGTPNLRITMTASSTCPNLSPRYQFWMLADGSNTWQLVQPYSTNASFSWNTAGAPAGTEYFEVWVRDATSPGIINTGLGSSYDSYISSPFTLT
jgi:hypothetical protein